MAKLFIISGPSGSGKTTLIDLLMKKQNIRTNFVKSISSTTRVPRGNESDGVDYFFISLKMFLYKKRKGHFLETEKNFGNYYGTSKKSIEAALRRGKSIFLCIDVKGAQNVMTNRKNVVSIFIKTSTFAELKKRLISRKSEDMESVRLRIKEAKKEVQESQKYDYVVINDDLSQAAKHLEKVLNEELGL